MDQQSKLKLCDQIHRLYQRHFPLAVEKTHPELRTALLHEINESLTDLSLTEERLVNILISDLRGFTALSENYSPLEVIDLLNRYFAGMSKVIEKYNGNIDKLMGDSIMVLFGAPESSADDLERALACAVEMQYALDEINKENTDRGYPPLYMGIGINTGKVVAGKLGSDLYSEYTVIGDHVNLASRIESYSLRGQILISEHTYLLAEGFVEIGMINTLQVKGKKEPVKMYELLAVNQPVHIETPRREIRNSPRIDLDMPLSFQIIEDKQVTSELCEGHIIDISYGGMYISSKTKLAPYSEIKFPLSLSLSANKSSDVYAKVLRENPTPTEMRYHLEFSSISQEDEDAVRHYINRIIERP